MPMPAPATIDALLFDLGRVLVDIDMTRIHRRWAEHAGLPESHFTPERTAALMRHEIFHGHERGHVSDATFFEHVRAELGLALSDTQMLDGWNSIFIGEMAGIRDAGLAKLAVVPNLKPRNATARFTSPFAGLTANVVVRRGSASDASRLPP